MADPQSLEPNLQHLSATDKLLAAARRAGEHLPAHMRADFAALFEPQALAITVGVLGGWAAAHVFGVGFAADLVLLLLGVVTLGFVALEAADALKDYVVIAASARTEQDLDRAAARLARAVSLIGVQTFVALITRGAGKRVQARMASAAYAERVARLERIVSAIRTKAHIPEVRQRIGVALAFMEESFPKMAEADLVGRLRAIDFHHPVTVVELPAGTKVVAYRQATYILYPERLMQGAGPVRQLEPLLGGSYYAPPGTPPQRLGIAGQREFVRYQTKRAVKVLQSTASGARDSWSRERVASFTEGRRINDGELVGGGGTQYIIADPNGRKRIDLSDILEVVQIAQPRL